MSPTSFKTRFKHEYMFDKWGIKKLPQK